MAVIARSETAAEQAAHESSCPLAFVNGLFAQQPLAVGQVRAFDGDEEGGRRRRQRVFGPEEDDAPPSDAAVAVMMMSEATAALRKHLMVARVAQKVCEQIRRLSKGMTADFLGELPESMARSRSLCVCGLDAVVEAMRAHPAAATVQEQGCWVLANVCSGSDAAGARLQRAAEAGALEAVVAALNAHPQSVGVQEHGCAALCNVQAGTDNVALARAERAAARDDARKAARAGMQPAQRGAQLALTLQYVSSRDHASRSGCLPVVCLPGQSRP